MTNEEKLAKALSTYPCPNCGQLGFDAEIINIKVVNYKDSDYSIESIKANVRCGGCGVEQPAEISTVQNPFAYLYRVANSN